MSITNELMEWASSELSYKTRIDELIAIADRIDAEHERAVMSAMNDALYHANDESMAELGWVRLPKDADGEYIHIGDVMVYADDNTCPLPVTALVPPVLFLTYDGPRYADMCRHAPTVEDMLWELLGKIAPSMEDEEAVPIVKAYAEKLRIADSGEE